jgi:hypothetical protein
MARIDTSNMNDVEFIDHWIENSAFIDPVLFRELQSRRLTSIVNLLPGANTAEKKSSARVRLAKAGIYLGEPEIETIAAEIERVKSLQKQIAGADPADPTALIKLIDTMKAHLVFVKDYFK